MDGEEEAQEVLQICLDDYVSLMNDYFYTVTSVIELEQGHLEVKSEILEQLPQKWRFIVGSLEMPSTTPDTLSQKLDEEFVQLKKYFERSKSRNDDDENESDRTAHQIAIDYYTDQIEKYLKNRPNAAPKELDMHHDKVSDEAIARAISRDGTDMTSEMVVQLRMALQDRHDIYRARAEINQKSLKDPAIGIDLGTTKSCVMVYYKSKVEVVLNRAQGNSTSTPSYVAFHEDGTDTFGIEAKEQAYRYPEITIYDAKRMIGRQWNDEMLQEDRKKWPFEVVNDKNNPKIKTWGRTRFPHEVSTRLLTRFRIMAEAHLGLPPGAIRKAVITVPAYFTEPQRRATSEAAECAGLEVLNILSEPTAAAIAYSWERRDTSTECRRALIYDLGGGTFDVAIANVTPDSVEILAVDGDTHLGGQDVDQLLMDHCLEEFKKTEGIDLEEGRNSTQKTERDSARCALSRVKQQCEKVKERLATCTKDAVSLEFIYQDKSMHVTITSEKLDQLIKPLVEKTLNIVGNALESVKDKGISRKEDIDDVILVGGSSRLKLVEKMLSDFFGGKQLCKHINPDEAVAYGAAVQAAIINNDENVGNVSVQDVIPLSLGCFVEHRVDDFCVVIPKNVKTPCSQTLRFVTAYDNQQVVRLAIFQGEATKCKENKLLGHFDLEGVPPKPAGEEKLDFTMTIDSMGILHVEAVSCSTGKANSITVKAERLGMDKDTMSIVKKECEKLALDEC